jgi:hypothetical protein
MGMVVNGADCKDKTSMDVWCPEMDKAILGKAGKRCRARFAHVPIAGWVYRWGAQ